MGVGGGSWVYLLCLLNLAAAWTFYNEEVVPVYNNRKEVVTHTYLRHPTHVIKRRGIEQKMRFSVYYDPMSIDTLPNSTKKQIKDVLVPAAVSYFEKTLKVRSSSAKVLLERRCNTRRVGYIRNNPHRFCIAGCSNVTTCGPITVPREHLYKCYYAHNRRPDTSGVDGDGVDTDFLLYVSAVDDSCDDTAIAYSSHCQLESTFDRPIAGYLNICPREISRVSERRRRFQIATIKHEMIHSLGFATHLFNYYRDANGDPTTKRRRISNVPLKPRRGENAWSTNVTRQFTRRNWRVRAGTISHTVTMIVTPTVLREVRRHFDCSSLEGAELEDQGDTGTKMTHWELRVYGNEAMTSYINDYPVFSRITLALLEDTGWYKVNYAMADPMKWGYQLGCEFAQTSCMDYIEAMRAEKKSIAPYCEEIDSKNQECSLEGLSANICGLEKYWDELAPWYQNFASIPGVDDEETSRYAGSWDLSDYCPYTLAFVEVSAGSRIRSSECVYSSNEPDASENELLQVFGKDSKCISHFDHWILTNGSSRKPSERYGAGCYKITCTMSESTGFTVQVGTKDYTCGTAGDILTVTDRFNGIDVTGAIVCPSYQDVCITPTVPMYPDDISWETARQTCVDVACPSGATCREVLFGAICLCPDDEVDDRCYERTIQTYPTTSAEYMSQSSRGDVHHVRSEIKGFNLIIVTAILGIMLVISVFALINLWYCNTYRPKHRRVAQKGQTVDTRPGATRDTESDTQ